MATWEDGPEYAPHVRPAEFTVPDAAPVQAAPLDAAPPAAQQAEQPPSERPSFGSPTAPVAPLSSIVSPVAEERDPQAPFQVAASSLTSASAWGAVHGQLAAPLPPLPAPSIPPNQLAANPWDPPAPAPWDSPAPGPWPAAPAAWPAPPAPTPAHPLNGWPPPPPPATSAPGAAPYVNGFPAPGTPGWFGPGPYAPTPPPPSPVGFGAVLNAATPGLLISLLLGFLISPLAPILLGIAVVLSRRVQVSAVAVRRAFTIALAVLAFFGVLGVGRALIDFTGASEWWAFVGAWSRVICLTLLITVLVLAYRGLKRSPAPPPGPSPWG